MKIKLVSFSESKLVAMNMTHGVITDKVEEITGLEEEFLYCQTQKEMFAGVKDGIENANVIILAVDISRFISTKAALFRALGFKCRLNSEITNLINSDLCMATLNENQINAHAAIPVGGEAFITNDGLFSGFGIESGKQKLIFVPIDEKRIGAILENGMIAFLSKGVEKILPAEEPQESDIPEEMEGYVEPIENFEEPQKVSELDGPQYEEIYKAPEEKTEEEKPEEKDTLQDDFVDINSSSLGEEAVTESPAKIESVPVTYGIFSGTLSAIEERGIKVAFVRHKENAVYTKVLEGIKSSSSVIFVDKAMEEFPETEIKRKERLAKIAKKAIKDTDVAFSVAMTEIFTSDDGVPFIFAALSTGNKASVYKVYSSEEGESLEELYKAGLEGILGKIEESTTHVVSLEEDDEEEEATPAMGDAPITSSGKMTPVTQIIIWALIIVALCALSALIIDTVMSHSASVGEISHAYISEIAGLLAR